MKTNKTTAVATKSTKRPTPEGRKMKAATKITKEDELAVAAFRAMDNIDNNPAEIPMEDDEIARRKLVNAKFHALDKSATLSQFLDVALQRILEASKKEPAYPQTVLLEYVAGLLVAACDVDYC